MGRPNKYRTDKERLEAHRTASREWAARNREKVRATTAAWAKANPERRSETVRRSYWKSHGAEAGFTGFTSGLPQSRDEYRTRRNARQQQLRAENPEKRETARVKATAYYEAHREQIRQRARDRHAVARLAALEAYGGKCQHCGFSDARALQFDHVKGDGWSDRVVGATNSATYWRIVAASVDSGDYQLLCANCHWIKSHESGDWKHKRR